MSACRTSMISLSAQNFSSSLAILISSLLSNRDWSSRTRHQYIALNVYVLAGSANGLMMDAQYTSWGGWADKDVTSNVNNDKRT